MRFLAVYKYSEGNVCTVTSERLRRGSGQYRKAWAGGARLGRMSFLKCKLGFGSISYSVPLISVHVKGHRGALVSSSHLPGCRCTMGANRKLQQEIDRTLKKVQEGIEVFDQIWDKVRSTHKSLVGVSM